MGIWHINSSMWYSLNSVVAPGTGLGGWSTLKSHALRFADERSAKEFISKFLHHEMHAIEVRNAD